MGADGCAGAVDRLEDLVAFFASGYIACANLLRKTLPERNIAIRLNSDADVRISLWRRLLEQAAQPLLPL